MALTKEERKARRAVKNEAWGQVKELVDANPEYVDALKTLRPSLYGITVGTGGKSPRYMEVVDRIASQGSMDEDTLFAEFKIGRRETKGMIRKALRKSAPEDRKWISFDEESGTYTLEGEGADVPNNWEGFIPVDMTMDLDEDEDEDDEF